MKKIILMLLTTMLMIFAGMNVFAELVLEYKDSGVTLYLTEAFETGNHKGVLYPYSMGQVGSGVTMCRFIYYAMPRDEFIELTSKEDPTEEEEERVISSETVMCSVFSIDGGRGIPELIGTVFENPVPEEYFTKIAEAGDVTFYSYIDQKKTGEYTASLEPEYAADFTGLQEAFDEVLKNADYYVPIPVGTELVGTTLRFDTVDIDGNPVSSSDLFKENQVTMINIWATTCHWCIEEMPGLVELNHELAGKGAAIIGICADADNKPDVCRSILEESGVDYPNLMPFDNMEETLMTDSFPMTYFVDSEGVVLSLPFIGAPAGLDMSVYSDAVGKLMQGEEVMPEGNGEPPMANDAGVFRVTVTDTGGDPVEEVTVQFCSETSCMFGETDEDGIAEFKAEEGSIYTIHILEVPDGYEETDDEYETSEEYCDVHVVLQKEA